MRWQGVGAATAAADGGCEDATGGRLRESNIGCLSSEGSPAASVRIRSGHVAFKIRAASLDHGEPAMFVDLGSSWPLASSVQYLITFMARGAQLAALRALRRGEGAAVDHPVPADPGPLRLALGELWRLWLLYHHALHALYIIIIKKGSCAGRHWAGTFLFFPARAAPGRRHPRRRHLHPHVPPTPQIKKTIVWFRRGRRPCFFLFAETCPNAI